MNIKLCFSDLNWVTLSDLIQKENIENYLHAYVNSSFSKIRKRKSCQNYNLSPCFMYMLKYCFIHEAASGIGYLWIIQCHSACFLYQHGKTEVDDDKSEEVGVQ